MIGVRMTIFWLRPFTAGGNKASNGLPPPPPARPLVLNPSACAPSPNPKSWSLFLEPESWASSPQEPSRPPPQPRATDQSHDVKLPYKRIKKGRLTAHKSFKVGHPKVERLLINHLRLDILRLNMQCNTCGQLFNSVCRFYLHRRQHRKLACRNCDEIFTSKANLVKHEKKRKEFTCHHCDGKFCNNDHLQKHLRSIRGKEQPPRSKENTLKWIKQLDEPVYPSIYEKEEGYQNTIRENMNEIQDHQKTFPYYQIHNKEIDSGFTYRNLRDMILQIYTEKRNAFKVNLGFGFILYKPITDEWKYYYASQNNLLFDKAFTVINRRDITRLMRHVISLDLPTNYYLKKPSSNWTLGGLANVQIRIIDLKMVPIA